jgi:hypothetical protein
MQQHTNPIISESIATGSSSPIANIHQDLLYMSLRQKEDSRYDTPPPARPIIKESFVNSSSERLTIIAICAIAVCIIIARS